MTPPSTPATGTPHRRGRAAAAAAAWPLAVILLAGTGISLGALVVAIDRPWSLFFTPAPRYWSLVFALAIAGLLGALATVDRVRAARRGIAPSAGVLRVGFSVFVVASGVWLVWFQPFKALWLLMFWGVVTGVFAAMALAAPRLWRRRSGGAAAWARLRVIERAAFVVCVIAVALELGLRAIALLHPSPLFTAAGASPDAQLERYRRQPGELHYGFPFDSRGFYDDEYVERPDETLVCSISDSFAVGVVPHWFHFTTVAERELRGVAIYNAGVIATGPPEYLRILDETLLPLEPAAIVLCLFLGNDIVDADRFRPQHGWLRRWFDAANVMLCVIPGRLWTLWSERTANGTAGRVAEPAGSADLSDAVTARDPVALAREFPWLDDPTLERPSMTEPRFLTVESERSRAICVPGDARPYAPFFEVLAAIEQRCGDVPLLLLLLPDEFQVEDALWAELERRHAPLSLDRYQPQRLVRAWLDERGLPYLDLLPHLRAVAPLSDGRRHVYLSRDTHFNRRGNEVVGQALAGFLREHLR